MAVLPGTRIRDNGVFGNITDNPLTAGATSFNSADLSDLSIVLANHALVTLDPLREFGDPEIVMVTAHTAAATVATIQRGMFGTVARDHPVNTLWVHAAADNDFREIVTSSTRPGDQYLGQSIFETDTSRIMAFEGGTWKQEGLLFDPPACALQDLGGLNLPHNTLVVPIFDEVDLYDTDGMHNPALNPERITINTPGIYLFTGWVALSSDTDYTELLLRILIDGATDIGQTRRVGASSGPPQLTVSGVGKFTAGQFATLEVRQANTSAGTATLGTRRFTATWIGRGN